MTAILERSEKAIQPTYHNLSSKVDTSCNKDVLTTHPHFNRLVELCSQAFEKSHIQVYENGGQPYVPTDKQDRRYFTLDPVTYKRVNEIPKQQTQDIPMHIPSADGMGMIPLKQVFIVEKTDTGKKKRVEYWRVDMNGVPIKEDGKPKKINVEPVLLVPQNTIDRVSGLRVKVYTEREILKEEIEDLVAFYFRDIIEHPERQNAISEWINAFEVAPAIISLMTDKDAYIEGVQKSHALHIVVAALQIARNPDTKIKIVSGFGASDTEPSNCYVGNALPALQMADNIRAFFESRKTEGKRGLIHAPLVELIFAQEAGIQANFKDKADFVRQRMAKNMDLVRKFASELFPDVQVVFNQDIPWTDLSPETLAVIKYNASLIKNSHAVKDTLANLVQSGHTKGTNGSTEETAAEYSGIHPFAWGLKPDYIPTKYLVQEPSADVIIRIGPRTESKFDAMIMTIKKTEDREGFIKHVLQQGLIAEVAEKIVNSARTYMVEKAPIIILETGRIGVHGPTYFTYNYDKPVDHPIENSIQELRDEAISINRSDLPSITRRTVLLARVYDLQIIANTKNSRLVTIS